MYSAFTNKITTVASMWTNQTVSRRRPKSLNIICPIPLAPGHQLKLLKC
uniref:Uncharacterized protein n=1 Tax=Rhizophora mucronata TaxID=61149 RepID=A0A2P2IYG5_RHIMU